MTLKDFEKVVHIQTEVCLSILSTKGKEYAPDAADSEYVEQPGGQLMLNVEALTDRLGSFKKAAAIMNSTPRAALFGMLSKHIISLSDMCLDNKRYSIDKWHEKITDSINYLLILRAIVEEEESNEKTDKR